MPYLCYCRLLDDYIRTNSQPKDITCLIYLEYDLLKETVMKIRGKKVLRVMRDDFRVTDQTFRWESEGKWLQIRI